MLDLGLLPHLLLHGFVLPLSYGVSRPRQEAFLLTLPLVPGLSREHRTGVLQGVSATRLMDIGWWDRLWAQEWLGDHRAMVRSWLPVRTLEIQLGFCSLKFLGLSKMMVR